MSTNPSTKEANEVRNASSSKNEEQNYVSRPVEVRCLRFQIHHGGMFVYYPTKVYVQGEMIEMNWDSDVDHMSYIEIEKLVKSIGYMAFHCLWYKAPKLGLPHGLKPLQNDQDVLEMIESAKGYKVIELYVDHLVDTPIVAEEVSGGKAAFAYTCRPLIGLDACFLKGEHGGQLMAAMGKDGNNMMLPIAYAVVEAETKESWQWFIVLLVNDLCELQQREYSFISDQQKGLVPAILSQSENVEHRLCVRHLYGNWRKKYPGLEMKEVLWWAARATTVPDWERAMKKMKDMNEDAWKDMMQLPPSTWSRSHYKTYTQCDLQVNNMCEAFNKAILDHRDKPIISLLEGLKDYITERIVTQKTLMERYKGNICPKIQLILERLKGEADGWSPLWHSDDDFALFGVSNEVDKYTVNLNERTCSCRMAYFGIFWQGVICHLICKPATVI